MDLIALNLEAPVTKDGTDWVTHVSERSGAGGWYSVFGRIGERMTGAWQRGIGWSRSEVTAHSTVFACMTLIASDISKMCLRLVAQSADGIWSEAKSAAFSPVLRRPNHFQNRIQFVESWVLSKLQTGNTYVLKERDARGLVIGLYVLDPVRVRPLVAPDGGVYYSLSTDYLAGLQSSLIVPAHDIIHDRMNTFYHPLCGISPLVACGLAAMQSLHIQEGSARFFAEGANLSGVLSAPQGISEATAKRIQDHWQSNFQGESNAGKVAVLGDGLKFEPMQMTAVNAQLVEQLKLAAEVICSTFRVPSYMVGIGPAPLNNNVEALSQQYYSQCLQSLIEAIELSLDEGLSLPDQYSVEFDIDDLLRMDTASLVKSEVEAVGGGIKKPNEARRRLNLPAVAGGDTPYMQEQNWPLKLLAGRDLPTRQPTAPAPLPPADPAPSKAQALFALKVSCRMKAEAKGLTLAAAA